MNIEREIKNIGRGQSCEKLYQTRLKYRYNHNVTLFIVINKVRTSCSFFIRACCFCLRLDSQVLPQLSPGLNCFCNQGLVKIWLTGLSCPSSCEKGTFLLCSNSLRNLKACFPHRSHCSCWQNNLRCYSSWNVTFSRAPHIQLFVFLASLSVPFSTYSFIVH